MRIYVFILLLFLTITGFVTPSFAAFPMHAEKTERTKVEKRSFEELINETIEKYRLPVPPAAAATDGGGVLSIVSFSLGIAGLASIIAALAMAAPAVLALGAVAGIAAIVLGAMGARRTPMRGLGIAGLVLGIIDVSVVLVLLLVAILVVALWLK